MIAVADSLKGRSFTRVADWSRDELLQVLDLADDLKRRQQRLRIFASELANFFLILVSEAAIDSRHLGEDDQTLRLELARE